MAARRIVFVAVLVGGSLTACTELRGAISFPVHEMAPTVAVTGAVHGNACVIYEPTDSGRTGGPVTVDSDPTGVTAVWLPGLNATVCASQLTRGDAKTAQRLAADVRSAAPIPPGSVYHCPAGVR